MLLIEKCDFQKLPYVLDHEMYFGKKNFKVKDAKLWDAQRKSMADFGLCKEEKTCSFFHVGDSCPNLKENFVQQWESYIDLRTSLFQQGEIDTGASSLA